VSLLKPKSQLKYLDLQVSARAGTTVERYFISWQQSTVKIDLSGNPSLNIFLNITC